MNWDTWGFEQVADDSILGHSLGTLPIKDFDHQFQALHKCFSLCEEDIGGCCNVIFGKDSVTGFWMCEKYSGKIDKYSPRAKDDTGRSSHWFLLCTKETPTSNQGEFKIDKGSYNIIHFIPSQRINL